MDIGDPTIFKCPSCGKKMQMTNWTSYTVSSSISYSDGVVSQSGVCSPNFTPDLSKCPHCKNLFFRHNVEDAETVNLYKNKIKANIQDPERDDLINAVKNKIFKKCQEEKQLREMLWHDLNRNVRQGYNEFSGDILKIWKDNCAALMKLTEKTQKETQPEKSNKKHDDNDRESNLLITAELNRNLGNFDKCMELISGLKSKWTWLKKQFALECEAKNIYTFELMTKKEMNLDKDKNVRGEDFYKRAEKFLPPFYGRRNLKKALADFIRAESLGMKGTIFYKKRGLLYFDELNDPDKAIDDFSNALNQKDSASKNSKSDILACRSKAYLKKGDLKKALADLQTAIEDNENDEGLYTARSEVYEAMGDTRAAESDKLKAKELTKKRLDFRKMILDDREKVIKRGKKHMISEL